MIDEFTKLQSLNTGNY